MIWTKMVTHGAVIGRGPLELRVPFLSVVSSSYMVPDEPSDRERDFSHGLVFEVSGMSQQLGIDHPRGVGG